MPFDMKTCAGMSVAPDHWRRDVGLLTSLYRGP